MFLIIVSTHKTYDCSKIYVHKAVSHNFRVILLFANCKDSKEKLPLFLNEYYNNPTDRDYKNTKMLDMSCVIF